MHTLPQLIEEDIVAFNAALSDLIGRSEASLALITDKAGFCLTEQGSVETVDSTTLAALASGSFEATQAIARILDEPNFSCVYQQGERVSMLVSNIDSQTVLIVVFPSTVSVGVVKFYGAETIANIAKQMEVARSRAPGQGLDLAMLNMADSSEVFKKREG
jgi:predicted regulator of Ras-like GTPase activity (Roadblock/LC7/MglB family)